MIKRAFDIVSALAGLLLLAPVLALIAALIKAGDGGPVFYRGSRVGLDGRMFRIYKFRTMIIDAEAKGPSSTAQEDARITGFGRELRKYKLDELPQLINVLLGDMSIVGPRPQVAWAVDLYTAAERELLSVRPGITDYASIKFRDEAKILEGEADPDKAYLEKIAPEKIRLGLEYVRAHSLWIDLKIIGMTLMAVAKRENAHG